MRILDYALALDGGTQIGINRGQTAIYLNNVWGQALHFALMNVNCKA